MYIPKGSVLAIETHEGVPFTSPSVSGQLSVTPETFGYKGRPVLRIECSRVGRSCDIPVE